MTSTLLTPATLESPRSSTMPILLADGLVKTFGATQALRGASAEIGAGEVVAVMGPSGSGKSTLLHCIAGILKPDSGRAMFAGQDLATMSERERSRLRLREFGFVFQYGQLVPDLPAEENVALPLLLRGDRRKQALEAAREWMNLLGLDGKARKLPGELSGGEAQRVAIARAFAIEPRVIFADEPTGSLDSLAGEAVMEMLTSAAREQGVTVVLVTHDVRVAAYADREMVVRDGRVTAGGLRL